MNALLFIPFAVSALLSSPPRTAEPGIRPLRFCATVITAAGSRTAEVAMLDEMSFELATPGKVVVRPKGVGPCRR